MMDSGVTRSKRVAIVEAAEGNKLVLTEFEVMDPRPGAHEMQLQLTTFAPSRPGAGAYARLNQYQARKLLEALDQWLNGRGEAP